MNAADRRYKRLLVPLDGSALAEAAFEEALALARLTDAEVSLLRVVAPPEDVIEAEGEQVYDDSVSAARTQRSQDYLVHLTRRSSCEGIPNRCAVAIGRPAETILSFARANGIDTIVLTPQGRSADRQWALGGVAEKVLRGAEGSVILVRQPRRTRAPEPGSSSPAASSRRSCTRRALGWQSVHAIEPEGGP